jgi:glycine/D-amino acid oxidase-like deaminating enzyme
MWALCRHSGPTWKAGREGAHQSIMSEILVVGAGVSGAVIAMTLQAEGHHVVVIDDAREGRATPASAGVIHPGWVDAFDKREVEDGLALLNLHYGLRTIEFDVGKDQKVECKQLSPSQYQVEAMTQRALAFLRPEGRPYIKVPHRWTGSEGHGSSEYEHVILCCGSWANELAKDKIPKVDAMAGTAFIYDGMGVAEPMLRPWAPYKQLMAFNRDRDHVWMGDGTAILAKNYTKEREDQSRQRIIKWYGFTPTRSIRGYRPTVRGQKGGLCQEIDKNVWVVTGGSKNGTIFAAIAANRLRKVIK